MKAFLAFVTGIFFCASLMAGVTVHSFMEAKLELERNSVITAKLLSLSLRQLQEENI